MDREKLNKAAEESEDANRKIWQLNAIMAILTVIFDPDLF